ncbi:pentapeptide repeat-containing protein [Sorangium sp. So ce542]|uniref:pentapeptide repeat-containing protein n=1 Tax=Sorangium sp. So ce542 TaxID=3133316 RepID=UPI003F622430
MLGQARHARLAGARLAGARLAGARLGGARLAGARLGGGRRRGARLAGVGLGGGRRLGGGGRAGAQVRPEALADGRRQHVLQVLERGPAEVRVVGVERPVGDLERLALEAEREHTEDVLQAAARPLDKQALGQGRLGRRGRVRGLGVPHPAVDLDLPRRRRDHVVAAQVDRRALLEQARERHAALVAHLEALVGEAEHQPVGGALGGAALEHARDAAPDGEAHGRVEQRVEELAGRAGGDGAERADRLRDEPVALEEREEVRDERGVGLAGERRERPADALVLARAEVGDRREHRVGRERGRRGARRERPLGGLALARRGARAVAGGAGGDRRPGGDRRAGEGDALAVAGGAPGVGPGGRPPPEGGELGEHLVAAERVDGAAQGAAGGRVDDVRRVERDGAGAEAALERGDVAPVEPRREEQGDARGRGAEADEERQRRVRREREQDHGEAAADRRADAVEAHVDEGLDRPLLVRGQGRVEQLVARPEEGVPEHGLGGADDGGGPEARRDHDGERAREDGGREDADGGGEPEPVEREGGGERLHEEREQADREVEEREEREQLVAVAHRVGGLGAEGHVEERAAHRAEPDEQGEVAQVGALAQGAEAGGAGGGAGGGGAGGGGAGVVLGVALGAGRGRAREAGAEEVGRQGGQPAQPGEGEEHGRGVHEVAGAPGEDAADDAAERAAAGDAPHGVAGGVGVEALVDERPEGGDEGRAEDGDVQVEDQGGGAGRAQGEGPLQAEEDGARGAGGGDDARGRELQEGAREQEDRGEREHRAGGHDLGDVGGAEGGEEEGVAGGAAGDLLGDHRAGREGGDEDGPRAVGLPFHLVLGQRSVGHPRRARRRARGRRSRWSRAGRRRRWPAPRR